MTFVALAGSPNPLTTNYDAPIKSWSKFPVHCNPGLCHHGLDIVWLRQHLAEKAEIRVIKQAFAELCVLMIGIDVVWWREQLYLKTTPCFRHSFAGKHWLLLLPPSLSLSWFMKTNNAPYAIYKADLLPFWTPHIDLLPSFDNDCSTWLLILDWWLHDEKLQKNYLTTNHPKLEKRQMYCKHLTHVSSLYVPSQKEAEPHPRWLNGPSYYSSLVEGCP